MAPMNDGDRAVEHRARRDGLANGLRSSLAP